MAQSPLSMFDVQPQLSYEDQARRSQQAAMQYAQLSGPQQSQYNMFQTAAGVAQPVADLVRAGAAAATGQPVDNPQAKIAQVRAKVQAALQGANTSDPNVTYPVMIRVLQEEGMVSQAMALQKEFEEITNKRRDDERATEKDAANAAFLKAKADALNPGSQLAQSVAAYQKAMAVRDAQPEGSQARATAQKAVDAFEAKLLQQHKVSLVPAGDRVQIIDAATGALIREVPKGVSPDAQAKIDAAAKKEADKKGRADEQASAAADAAVAAADDAIRAIDRMLANNRFAEVAGMTGFTKSKAPGTLAFTVASELESLGGRTFLDALATLKAAGKNGSTGLGALSDAEGNRITMAAGQLKPGTSEASLLTSLNEIRTTFQRGRERAAKLKGSASAPAPSAPAAAPSAPAAAPAATGGWSIRKL